MIKELIKIVVKKENAWFSSDWHLFHPRVLIHDKRPFENITLMNDTIISNFSCLTEKDTLFYLGDISFGKSKETLELLSKLKCKIIFILGNHDKPLFKDPEFEKRFEYVFSQKMIQIDMGEGEKRQNIMLNHYSMEVWGRSHYGTWHLFGHSHHSLPDNPNKLSLDMGCNGWNYKPVSIDMIAEKMKLKTWKPIDHHDGTR